MLLYYFNRFRLGSGKCNSIDCAACRNRALRGWRMSFLSTCYLSNWLSTRNLSSNSTTDPASNLIDRPSYHCDKHVIMLSYVTVTTAKDSLISHVVRSFLTASWTKSTWAKFASCHRLSSFSTNSSSLSANSVSASPSSFTLTNQRLIIISNRLKCGRWYNN